MIHKRSTALERSLKYFSGGLKSVIRRIYHVSEVGIENLFQRSWFDIMRHAV